MYHSLAMLVLTAALLGCSAGGQQHTAASSDPVTIQIGSGGGFSGHMTGLKIDPQGIVTRWSGLPGTDLKPDTIGSLSNDQLTPLYKIIDRDSLMTFDHVFTGNMTASLVISRGDRRNSMRWPGLETDLDDVPPRLRPFVEALMQTLKQTTKPGK